MARAVEQEFGRIDILINNAGGTRMGPLSKLPTKAWDSIYDLNVKGAYVATREAGQHMIAQKSGAIVNISSGAGINGVRGGAHYSAAKSALQQELGATLMVDANNCVLLLNDLDERGYVERQRDPRDRRRHIVVITTAGTAALEKAQAKLEELEGEVLANLAQSEREQLRDLLAHAMEGQDASVDVSCLQE